jgi:hypothetical protein
MAFITGASCEGVRVWQPLTAAFEKADRVVHPPWHDMT